MHKPHSWRHTFRALPVLFALALALGAQTQVFAYGARHSGQTTIRPASVSCSGSNCTGKDPYSTGCINGAYILHWNNQPGYIGTGAINLGQVNLWWSPACQTNWAEVVFSLYGEPGSTAFAQAIIEGASTHIYWWAKASPLSVGQSMHSPMYYAPSESTEARGYIVTPPGGYPNNGAWGDGYVSQTGNLFDENYCGGGSGVWYCYN